MSAPAEYPPDHHVTRDLDSTIERRDGQSTILLPIVPALLDPGGRLRVGAAATIVDIVCGETAIREVLPGWIATSNMSLQIGDMPGEGTLRARPRVVRHGKTTLVEEVELDHVETGASVGLGTASFAILPVRSDFQARAHWAEDPEPTTNFSMPDSGFRKPLLEAIGVRFDEANSAIAHADKTEYVVNTLGAMQGGVVAMFIDGAADHYAARELGGVTEVRSLEIHYLKLAKVGPIRATSRTIGRLGSGLVVRVELRDEGQDEALLTIANVVVDRASAP